MGIELVQFAEAIMALDQKAFAASAEARSLRARLAQAQADGRLFMEQRDVQEAGRRGVLEQLNEAIETLRWIYHGHTDDVQDVRDVARRRLVALGVVV